MEVELPKEPAEEIKASPLAKKMAQERGVDLRQVTGTGPGGRIKKEDVEQFIAEKGKKEEPPAAQAPQVASAPPVPSVSPVGIEKTVKLRTLRGNIAERFTGSYQQAPHIFLFSQVEMTEIQNILKQSNEEGTVKLSVIDFLIKVSALSLEKFKNLNTSLQGDEILFYGGINIGMATSLEEGLMVPVFRNPQRMPLRQIASLRETLMAKAKENRLQLDDLEGGTFTLENLGMYGIDFFTSTISPPQCATLSVGEIQKVPRVNKREELKIVPVMKVGLAMDHRIVDAAYGARFLDDLRKRLEKPYLIL
jgi:pyruvate dehydrogenase E2 component (dihydrolipoamide acetyltransferase)